MNGEAARASKREIRRAFGPQAMQTVVDHQDAIAAHTQQLRDHEARLDRLAGLGEEDRQHNASSDVNLFARLRLVEKKVERGFLGRLRWLVTGK